jgi:hypothetical protein
MKRHKPLRRKKPMVRVNRRRKAKRDALTFGEQADLTRYMQCCVCRRYGEIDGRLQSCPDALARDIAHAIAAAREWRSRYGIDARVSDPSHLKTRGAGGRDEDCCPMCRKHHRELGGINSGIATFQKRHAIDLKAIAAAIHEVLSKECAA